MPGLDLNVVLNVITILGLCVGAYYGSKYVKVRDFSAQMAAKDATIKTQGQSIDSLGVRVGTLESDLLGVQSRANALHDERDEARAEVSAWQARYDEQAKYTAKPAFEALTNLLTEHVAAVADRHEKMLASSEKMLETLERLVASLPLPP